MSDEKERFFSAVIELDKYLTKCVLVGNAGGVIAVLTFIGNQRQTDSGEGYGLGLFVILVVFTFGMILAWISMLSELGRITIEAANRGHMKNDDSYNRRMGIIGEYHFIYFSSSVVLFVLGVFGALTYLWILA